VRALVQPGRAWAQTATLPANPFTLGVASGDPRDDGMVLWTRLAPSPLQPDGGMPPAAVDVRWQIANDEGLTDVVRSGTVRTTPDAGHSVHVELTGLPPDRWYFYRFEAAGYTTRVARTRTMPAAGVTKQELRFAVAGCQQYEAGFYSAFANMAREELDLVLHTGDYIYEGGGRATGILPPNPVVRDVVGGETLTLADYRVRHAQYKTDPQLQAAHDRFPFVGHLGRPRGREQLRPRRQRERRGGDRGVRRPAGRAYQAYYEHMPLRSTQRPTGPDLRLYRGLEFGTLARLNVLDTRQYRDNQPCGDGLGFCAERTEPGRTLLGAEQRDWLHDRLRTSPAIWNALNQQVVVASFDYNGAPGQAEQTALYNLDSWDGYDAERNALMDVFAEERVTNPVVLTGDVHSFWANDLRQRFFDDRAPLVGSEFVGTSITSVGIPTAVMGQALADNPHTKFYNGELHGYLRCTVTPELWTTDYRSVTARTADEPAFTAVTFVTEAGRPGVQLDTVGGRPAPEPPAPGGPPPPAGPGAPGSPTSPDGGSQAAGAVRGRSLPATGAAPAASVAAAVVLGGAVVARRYLDADD
jgi:alkaline phosphatase D